MHFSRAKQIYKFKTGKYCKQSEGRTWFRNEFSTGLLLFQGAQIMNITSYLAIKPVPLFDSFSICCDFEKLKMCNLFIYTSLCYKLNTIEHSTYQYGC